MMAPVSTPSFHTALSQELSIRVFAAASQEYGASFSAYPPQDLLPKSLGIDPNATPAAWFKEVRPLASRAAQHLSIAEKADPKLAWVLQPGFQPDEAWLKGTRTYLEDLLREPQTRLRFVERLRQDPENRELWMVYGDWLLERGDMRGDLIHIDLQLKGVSSPAKQNKLKEMKREREERMEKDFRLRNGLLNESVQLSWNKGFLRLPTFFSSEIASHLLKLEEASLIKELHVRKGREPWSDFFCHPQLRAIASLNLSRCRSNFGGYGMRALASSAHVGSLTSLALESCGLGNQGVEILAKATNLGSLVTLDLQSNCIGREGILSLIHSAHLGSMKALDLSYNSLTEQDKALLRDWSLRTGIRIDY